MTDKTTHTQQIEDDEIDLIALAKTVWDGRKTIIRTTIIFALIGLAVALLSPKEYTASTVMVPQTGKSGSKLGGLSSLAAMAGFNLDMSGQTETLSPMVYPQIVNSVPFQLELMNTPFTFSEENRPVSLYDYYTEIKKPGVLGSIKKYTVGLPFVVLKAIKVEQEENTNSDSSGFIALTEEQEDVRKELAEKVGLEINDKDGYISLSANMPEALLAAQVTQKAQEMLQAAITKYKIQKASEQLSFIEERYAEKKKEFERAQENLAQHLDRNKNITNALARTEEQRLQSEYSIALNVYNELSKQLEHAKIQVKEDTPILSVLQPVQVPVKRTKPNRPMILIIWTFLGGIIGIGWIFGKKFISSIKQQWSKED